MRPQPAPPDAPASQPAKALAWQPPTDGREGRWITRPDQLWELYLDDPELKLTAVGAAVLAG